MTLLEIERLVRKMSELLQQVGNAEIAPKLAGDYAAACHAANLRLQQCEAMIKAGDRHQAIQLAETAPNLLDSVTALEFDGSDDWRTYCQQNSLPVADRIDGRSVKILNDCYAQGITTDHPLYAAYRRAVLGRNDEEALKTLQSIVRLNPSDSNAATELSRLDAKVLGTRMRHLETVLDGADPGLLVAYIETIESFGFKNQPQGETWRKAQAIRCEFLLDEISRLKGSSAWMEALSKIDFIHHLKAEFKLELKPDTLSQVAALEKWARGEQEKDKKEREFSSLLSELQYRIHQSEEKDTSARFVKLPELRDDYEALHKVWRGLTDFTRPIPDEAASKFKKRSGLLEVEIARRTAIQRRLILISSLTVLLVGGLVAWFALGQIKARAFSKQVQDAMAHRQFRTVNQLLDRAHNELLGDPSILAEAETFKTREAALAANFDSAFSKLPKKMNGQPDSARLAEIADQLVLTRNSLDAMAPDLKTENEPRVLAFEKDWQRFLAESGTAVNVVFDQWVTSAERQCDSLNYRAPLDEASNQLVALSAIVQRISDCETGFSNHLNLRGDLLQRAAATQAKFAAYDREFKKLNDGMVAIERASNFRDFSDGVALIASSEYSTAPLSMAASLVQSLHADNEAVLRWLLSVTNAGTWAYVTNANFTHFLPEVAMPVEKQMFQQLKTDPAVGGRHEHYRLWLTEDGAKSVEWITAGPLATSVGWKRIMAFTPSGSAGSAVFENRDYGFFDGKYRLSPTEPVYRAESMGDANESITFDSVGLETVWIGGDSYGKPLLEVVDSLKNSTEGSPLFRAYLITHLTDLMNFQPNAWGLAFCPSLRAHDAQIRTIVGGRLSSGDWFLPAKTVAFSAKLDQFFNSTRNISYTKQAEGLLMSARAVSKDGFQYIGFVGSDGRANFVNGSTPSEVWGFNLTQRQPVLLSTTGNSAAFTQAPLPLSPLFSLPKPRSDYLVQAGINADEASFQRILPPLFGQTQKQ